MAVTAQPRRRRETSRPLPRRRTGEPESPLPLVVLTLVIVVAVFLVLSGHLFQVSVPRSLVLSVEPAAQHRPVDGAAPVADAPMGMAEAQPVDAQPVDTQPIEAAGEPSAAAAPDGLTIGGHARVANTDNLGVVFHNAPRPGTRQPAGLLEGTRVTVLELSGAEWARVQSDSKKSGWVHAQYLAPAE